MAIPIQNIYYLLCYAWNIIDEQDKVPVSAVTTESALNLLVHLLQQQGKKLVSKGLVQGYTRKTDTLKEIKGKLEFTTSVRQDLFRQGRAVCTHEILSPDILPNQIIKTVIYSLLNTGNLTGRQKEALRTIDSAFQEVSLINLTSAHFHNLSAAGFYNKYYAQALAICEFIWQQLLPEPSGHQYQFIDFREDEVQMAKLFEAFVRNFYRLEQSVFTVKSEWISWQVAASSAEDLQYLPNMLTDISLTSSQRTIIIDTKYYKQALVLHYDKQKLISGHLYQLFAYLKNQQTTGSVKAEGILLYPVVNQELDLTYQLPGHQISIKTVNLNQPWQNIKSDLLNLIYEPTGRTNTSSTMP